ncbi:hypothetical protein GLE_4906 [Lysobacter enzymogenes]|uniref:Uncharacterized protein n=1 Tax=Lysobacter enzymogenes TaxID=69 RepID=A0A0S2DNL9_LYSEN|nr:hypothetical protein GLE_4906 [Lysobacter enzymogenes]
MEQSGHGGARRLWVSPVAPLQRGAGMNAILKAASPGDKLRFLNQQMIQSQPCPAAACPR